MTMPLTDVELKAILASAGWEVNFTYQDGREEFMGPSGSEWPNISDIRALVEAAQAGERNRSRSLADLHDPSDPPSRD